MKLPAWSLSEDLPYAISGRQPISCEAFAAYPCTARSLSNEVPSAIGNAASNHHQQADFDNQGRQSN
jgi:hypothetical protein